MTREKKITTLGTVFVIFVGCLIVPIADHVTLTGDVFQDCSDIKDGSECLHQPSSNGRVCMLCHDPTHRCATIFSVNVTEHNCVLPDRIGNVQLGDEVPKPGIPSEVYSIVIIASVLTTVCAIVCAFTILCGGAQGRIWLFALMGIPWSMQLVVTFCLFVFFPTDNLNRYARVIIVTGVTTVVHFGMWIVLVFVEITCSCLKRRKQRDALLPKQTDSGPARIWVWFPWLKWNRRKEAQTIARANVSNADAEYVFINEL